MIPDTEGLHPIANTDQPDRVADVVFVHGLGGSSHATWRHGREGEEQHFFWPEELGRELPQCGVWSFGYAAGFTQFGNPGMIIGKRAGNLAQQLMLAESTPGTNAGIGSRPVIFIMHSMGGLVVKSLIATSALGSPAQRQLVAQIRGLVFCGTPHRGSALASAARLLSEHSDSITRVLAPCFGWLGGCLVSRLIKPQAHLREMAAHAEPLDFLHDQFLTWQRESGVPVKTYAECHDLMAGGFLGRLIPLGKVVPRDSANTSIDIPTDVDADHSALVKPAASGPVYSLVYVGVREFVKNCSQQQASRSDQPSLTLIVHGLPAYLDGCTAILRKPISA
jgi:pimeloyl-ACP methyl ester carboxylesterase